MLWGLLTDLHSNICLILALMRYMVAMKKSQRKGNKA